MALSSAQQDHVQNIVDAATADERQQLTLNAEMTLLEINSVAATRVLDRQERVEAEYAIEMLVRLEATENQKGWWFRSKRRIQLVQMYLGR
jgi:hypothetical protein